MHKKRENNLRCFLLRAENETRTRDPNLGKVMLYQLSYFRICDCKYRIVFCFYKRFIVEKQDKL